MKPIPSFLQKPEIAEFCRQRQVARLSLFGSYLHGEAEENSDVDLLVEFFPNAAVGLLQMVEFEDELTMLLGVKVDLRTSSELSRYFRERVVSEARLLYAA